MAGCTLDADAYIGSATRSAGGTDQWYFQAGHVTQAAQVTALRVYIPVQGSGTGGFPSRITLFDGDGATVLATVDLSGVGSWPSGGWHTATLSPAVALEEGQEFYVGFHAPANFGYAFSSGAPTLSEVSGCDVLAGGVAAHSADYTGFVPAASGETPADSDTTWANTFRAGGDLVVDVEAPAGPTDLQAALTDWLSRAHNTVGSDSAPIHTDALATGTSGFDAIKAVADAISATLGSTASTIGNVVTNIYDKTIDAMGAGFDTGIHSLVQIHGQVQETIRHSIDVLAGHATTGSSTPNYIWTAGTPVDFTDEVLLAVAADAYLLNITTPSAGQPLNVFAGVHVYFRAGWWAECIDGVGSERHYIDFEQTWLRDGTRRLGGCLVKLANNGAGTITPYTLEPV